MPIYEYTCTKCHHDLEAIQKFSDPPLKKCPDCGGRLEKQMSAAAFHLKGSGWYKDGYASTKPEENKKEDKSDKSEDKPKDDKKDAKAETGDKKESSKDSSKEESKKEPAPAAKEPKQPSPSASRQRATHAPSRLPKKKTSGRAQAKASRGRSRK